MDYNNYNRGYVEPSMASTDYMARTYRWMALGLLTTFGVALATAMTPMLLYTVSKFYLLLTIAELAMVFMLSARVQSMTVSGARAAFFTYAALNGMVMSFYFVAYGFSTLIAAFLCAAVFFGLMAVYGTTGGRDLSAWGPKLMFGLMALLFSGIISMLFIGGGLLNTVLYCGLGLVVFLGLTAYDTQKLQRIYSSYAFDPETAEKASIYGALTLYLDFINIFLYVIRLMGNGRRRS